MDHLSYDKPNEYDQLRTEVIQRHERIHTSLLWAVGGVAAAIAYGMAHPEAGLVLASAIQLLLLLLASTIDDNYSVLYKMGTYIAFTFEQNSVDGPRWHRMTRMFDAQNEPQQPFWKAPWRHTMWYLRRWSPWGSASRYAVFVLSGLTGLNFVSLVHEYARLSRHWTVVASMPAVLGLLTVYPLVRLLALPNRRAALERDWADFHATFENMSEATIYELPQRTHSPEE